jgi:hypothetical protein
VVPSEVATPTSPIGTQPSTLYPSTPTPTLNVTASDAARQRIHTTTGFFAAASSLAIVAVFATLVLLWKRRLPEPGHVRFAEDASIDRGLDKRGTDDPATLGDYSDDDDDADSDVFHDDVEEPSYIITPSAVETLATVPKRVPSILKTSLSRDQYNARIKADEGNAIDGSPRKVRFTSPVPLPGPSERMDCRPMTQETNSQQEDDGVWLSWLNPRLDNSITYCGSFERISKPPVDIDSASFQRSAKSNVETDSIISLDSANSTLSAVLAAANDAEYDLYDDESLSQVLQRRVLGIRDRADLQAAARSRYAVGASRKDGDIFRRRDGRPPSSPAIRVVSVHVPNDFALGDEFGEV